MRAIRLMSDGSIKCLKLPVPEPGANEVLIKVAAAPLNPSDLVWFKGLYPMDACDFPKPTGFEGAGRVVKVGNGSG